VKTLAAAFVALMALSPERLYACSVCFGDPNSPLVQGAKYGVMFLAAIIYTVLFTMAGIVYFWYRRAKALEGAELTEPDAV
jgi:hypothetical protein